MVKFLVIVIAVVLALAIGVDVWAEDGQNLPDQLGDILTGKGQTYAGVEINNIPLPIVPDAFTMQLWAETLIGEIDDGVQRDIRGGVRVALDWQKIFK